MYSMKVKFYDKYGEKYNAIISNNEYMFSVKTYDNNDNVIADLIVYKENDNYFLEEIECSREYRNRGIASKLLELVDYLLQDSNGIIYGVFSPYDSSLSKIEKKKITKSFYEKNGYLVLSYDSFIDDSSKYSNIQRNYFTGTNKKYNNSIIVKQLYNKHNCSFIIKDNVLVEQRLSKIKK